MPRNKRDLRENEALIRLRSQLETESGESLELIADIENNPICSVSFDGSVPCVVVVWKRYVTSTQLRFVHENVLHLLKKHGASKILGDDTALPTIHDKDQAWITENWMPRAVAAGLKAGASKSPVSYFGRLSVSCLCSQAPEGLTIRPFDDLADARQWLQNFK